MEDIRQYTRDLSVLQRAGAMTALDRLKRDKMIREMQQTIPLIQPTFVGLLYLLLSVLKLLQLIKICLPRRIINVPLVRQNRRIYGYSPTEFRNRYNFNKNHAKLVMDCWQVFVDPIICDNGSKFHPEEAFLIYLSRMHNYEKLTNMQEHFGIEYTQLSRCFNHISYLMSTTHLHLLMNNLPFFAPRFHYYNRSIRNKCEELRPGDGGLPHPFENTCGFQDGTRLHVSRPGGNEQIQMRLYNGNDRIHCLEFQGVSFPDGMIGDLYGPVPGARHDSYINNISLIMHRMHLCQLHSAVKYSLYRDKAYPQQPPYGFSAYRNPPFPLVLAIFLAWSNGLMRSFRIGVEWGFGKIMSCTAFLYHHIGLKVYMCAVGQYYINAAIHMNTHTCLYGSQASSYFKCTPPSLGDYFNNPNAPL